ncbi:CGNR zinc finger domain-containing protein [Pseudonocardia sp. C8]|nr:CGNR zinc finger domain-containing protein [Pseudonocardia sp. C8]
MTPARTLVNTWYGHLAGGGDEYLATPTDLARWCRSTGVDVADDEVTGADLELAHAVREGVRALLARHNDAACPQDGDALDRLRAVAPGLELRVSPGPPPSLVPAVAGARGALALALAAPVLAGGKAWSRLKVCREPRCRTAFHDRSRNGSGVWCSMAACGAASKQRAFVERRRAQTQARRRASASSMPSEVPAHENRM